jgi:hypothetical protein
MGNSFGRENWNTYFKGIGAIIGRSKDVVVVNNTFQWNGSTSLIVTNQNERTRISGNSFKGPVVIANQTNTIFSDNILDGANAALNITNVNLSSLSGNIGMVANFGLGVSTNTWTGNIWRVAPAVTAQYWTNAIVGDSVNNRVRFSGQSANYQTIPYFEQGVAAYAGSAAKPSFNCGAGAAGIAQSASGSGYLGLIAGGVELFSISPSGYLYPTTTAYIQANGFNAVSGVQGGPSYNFANQNSDTDTGFYREAEDVIGFTTGGIKKALVTTTNLYAATARFDTIVINASGPIIKAGTGSPESVVTAAIGSLYLRSDGGAGTTLYVKESGAGTSTGWIAK